jgi:hypothetical protein
MTSTRRHEPVPTAGSELPQPHRGARWRWSKPRTTVVAGGALATVLSLGAGTVAAGAATADSSTPAGPRGQPPAGARPTVMGKVTALRGNDITVQARGKKTTTVVYSSATTFKTMSGPGGTSSGASASALEVGGFIGALGTRNRDGSVTASSIVIGTGPPRAGNGALAKRGAPPVGAPSA